MNEKLDSSIKATPILFADQLRPGHIFKILVRPNQGDTRFVTLVDTEVGDN